MALWTNTPVLMLTLCLVGGVGLKVGQHAGVGRRSDQGGGLSQGQENLPCRDHPAVFPGQGRAHVYRSGRSYQGRLHSFTGHFTIEVIIMAIMQISYLVLLLYWYICSSL